MIFISHTRFYTFDLKYNLINEMLRNDLINTLLHCENSGKLYLYIVKERNITYLLSAQAVLIVSISLTSG